MRLLVLSILSVACAAPLHSQVAPPPPPPPPVAPVPPTPPAAPVPPVPATARTDQFTRCLFTPEEVMARQGQIGLQDEQRTRIGSEVARAQARFTEAQWSLSGEQQRLEEMLRAPAIDEAAALRQIERILAVEQDLKRAQLTMMIRIKNALTAAQQDSLLLLRLQRVSYTASAPSPLARDTRTRAALLGGGTGAAAVGGGTGAAALGVTAQPEVARAAREAELARAAAEMAAAQRRGGC